MDESLWPQSSQDDIAKQDKQDEPIAEGLDNFNSDPYEDNLRDGELFDSNYAFTSRRENAYSNFPLVDVGDDVKSKDTGKTDWKEPNAGEKLESTKQQGLLKIRDVIGYDSVSDSKLQFSPQWMLDDVIQIEMRNFGEQKAFQKRFIKSLPRNSNICSSHHFFKIKYDGDEPNLKLKCRIVRHGNWDVEKE